VLAALSRRRSRVQVPSGPHETSRPGSSVGTSVRLKIGRSAVRPRPWPPRQRIPDQRNMPVRDFACPAAVGSFACRPSRGGQLCLPGISRWTAFGCRALAVAGSGYRAPTVAGFAGRALPVPCFADRALSVAGFAGRARPVAGFAGRALAVARRRFAFTGVAGPVPPTGLSRERRRGQRSRGWWTPARVHHRPLDDRFH
jgi:hypothetical protein